MDNLLNSLRSGNWKSLLACFLYFDTGFTVWVMFGALAPFITRQLSLSAEQQAFLVAVPVLSASIARITLGNLFQTVPGKGLALMGIALSAIPGVVLLVHPQVSSYDTLLILGCLLGIGGASFAVALPMAGSSYPPRVQGLVLGLAAAGNIGAVLDGFLFPGLAQRWGWPVAAGLALPLLAIAALSIVLWAEDRSVKSGSRMRAAIGFAVAFAGFAALVLLVRGQAFGRFATGVLLLPALGLLLALAVLPRRYIVVFAERDTWVMMLVYSVTFGGFVGMSSYVSLLLTTQYGLPKVDAGYVMAALSFTGAMLRPLGGWVSDRLSGASVLVMLLLGIAAANFVFAALMPGIVGALVLLAVLYVCFGLGNGATFQLVPQRWAGKTGTMTGIIGAAGGIGGFYLPVVLGLARQNTGSYQLGFAVLGAVALAAFGLVLLLRHQWRFETASATGARP